MATTRKGTTRDGKIFYEIRVSRGRGKSPYTTRWYPTEGWGQKHIDRELTKAAAEFERRCAAGEVQNRQEKMAELEQRRAEEAKILTLSEFGEKVFMPAKQITMSENSRASFQGMLNNWIYPGLGSIKMTEITPSMITALLLSAQSAGKAHATVVKLYTILNLLFKMAFRSDTIPSNPMGRVDRPKPRKDEVKCISVEAHTAEELRRIIAQLEEEPLKWRTFLRLMIDTGARRGECCALRWECVDFANNRITISGNLCYTPQRGVYMDTPKNGRSRTVDIDPEVTNLLRQLRREQASTAISQYVFTQPGCAEPMHPQSPNRFIQQFSERCGVPNMHPHKLRHSFASIAITHGADIASVSEKLGHSDKAVTLRMYTHADEESIRRASNIFRDALRQQA